MKELHQFTDKAELFKHLKENRDRYIAQKKFSMKCADVVTYNSINHNEAQTGNIEKGEDAVHDLLLKDSITVKSVVSTTNLLDSAGDVHIPGLWKKTLKEQKNLYLLKEHRMSFEHIISDDVKASTKNMSWKDLGFDYDGETEALIFDSVIDKEMNEYMFKKYARGKVKEHSVGMRYVHLNLCIKSDEKDLREEKENWDKYIVEVANKEDAEEIGYFWAVTEAKLVEGSAVLKGANWATPTQSVKEYEIENYEPPQGTQSNTEPPQGTQKEFFTEFIKLKN